MLPLQDAQVRLVLLNHVTVRLADGALDEPVTARRFVGRIQEATERLLQLVNNLLALTRLQARGVEPELVDVSDLVRRC